MMQLRFIRQDGQSCWLPVQVENSEIISELLLDRGIPHNVLNAFNIAREAAIVKDAGQPGAVTVATNMAGRGTDIKLGPGVKEKGGLAVIGLKCCQNGLSCSLLVVLDGREIPVPANSTFRWKIVISQRQVRSGLRRCTGS